MASLTTVDGDGEEEEEEKVVSVAVASNPTVVDVISGSTRDGEGVGKSLKPMELEAVVDSVLAVAVGAGNENIEV